MSRLFFHFSLSILTFTFSFLSFHLSSSHNSGVLPVVYFPGETTEYVAHEEVCLLFGERRANKKRWGDFGGLSEEWENHSSQAAARECYEETGTWKIIPEILQRQALFAFSTGDLYTIYLYPTEFVPDREVHSNAKKWAKRYNRGKMEVRSFDWVTAENLIDAFKEDNPKVWTITGKVIKIWQPTFRTLRDGYNDVGEDTFRERLGLYSVHNSKR